MCSITLTFTVGPGLAEFSSLLLLHLCGVNGQRYRTGPGGVLPLWQLLSIATLQEPVAILLVDALPSTVPLWVSLVKEKY